MMPLKKYRLLAPKRTEDLVCRYKDEHILSGNDDDEIDYMTHESQHHRHIIILYVVICILLATNVFLSATWAQNPYIRPEIEILGPAGLPVERIIHTFNTGISPEHLSENPFIGPSNHQTDAAWNTLLDIGLIRLNEEQASLLGAETAHEYNSTNSYVGVLEVFHQLHCLNRLRKKFYDTNQMDYYETDETIAIHTEHCFEYLRESIMCLGDVSIGPVGWEESSLTYVAENEPTKECRNFDKIHKWARDHEANIGPGNFELLHHN